MPRGKGDVEIRVTTDASGAVRGGRQVQGALGDIQKSARSLVKELALLGAGYLSVREGIRLVTSEIKKGLGVVEDINLSIAKMAALISSFQKTGDLGENYREAKEYAEGLIPILEEIDAKTIAASGDLQIITEEMVKQSILLDTNNQKAIDGFTNIANAAAVIAQGYPNKEIQLRQEIRALLEGQVRANSTLASQLDAMLDGTLKEHLETWKKEGSVIENIGALLKGYAAASDDLEGTWAVIGSTLETIERRILREGMKPVYNDLIGLAKDLNTYLKEHEFEIKEKILVVYEDLKETTEETYEVIKKIHSVYKALPSGTAEAGLILLVLGRYGPIGKFIGMLVLVNEALEEFDANLGSIPRDAKKVGDEVKNLALNLRDVWKYGLDAAEILDRLRQKQNTHEGAEPLSLPISATIPFDEGGFIKGGAFSGKGPPNLGGGEEILIPGTNYTAKDFWQEAFELAQSEFTTPLAEEMSKAWREGFGGTASPFDALGFVNEDFETFRSQLRGAREDVVALFDAFKEGTVISRESLQQLVDEGIIGWGQYIEGVKRAEEDRLATVAESEEQIRALKSGTINNAIGLLQVLGAHSKAAAIAGIALQKGLAIAQTIISGAAAEIRALAELGPIAGTAMALKIKAWTAANAAIIAATGLAQAASLGAAPPALGGTAGEPLPRNTERVGPYEKEYYGSGYKPGEGQQRYRPVYIFNDVVIAQDSDSFRKMVNESTEEELRDPGSPLSKLVERRR